MKKTSIVVMCQSFLWIGFSVILSFSQRDKLHSKVILFMLFWYVTYVVANYCLQARMKAISMSVKNGIIFLFIYYIITFIIVYKNT